MAPNHSIIGGRNAAKRARRIAEQYWLQLRVRKRSVSVCSDVKLLIILMPENVSLSCE